MDPNELDDENPDFARGFMHGHNIGYAAGLAAMSDALESFSRGCVTEFAKTSIRAEEEWKNRSNVR